MSRLRVALAPIAVTMAVGLLAGCSAATPAAESSSAAGDSAAPAGLISPDELSVCMALGYAPMEYLSDGTSGEVIGFDADAARALAGYWGLGEPDFQDVAFDGLVPGLDAGRCDVLWSALYMSESRLEVVDGTAYLKTGPVIVAAEDAAADYRTSEDLCGLNIAAAAGTSYIATLQAVSDECVASGEEGIDISEYPKPQETVLAVTGGKADALIETDVSAADIVANVDGLAISSGVFEMDTEFGVFTKKDGPLSAPVAEAIAALIEDGTFAELAEKYGLDPANIATP